MRQVSSTIISAVLRMSAPEKQNRSARGSFVEAHKEYPTTANFYNIGNDVTEL